MVYLSRFERIIPPASDVIYLPTGINFTDPNQFDPMQTQRLDLTLANVTPIHRWKDEMDQYNDEVGG